MRAVTFLLLPWLVGVAEAQTNAPSFWGSLAANTASSEPSPTLSVAWIDVTNAAPFAFEGATREASDILERAGLRTTYRRAEAGTEAAAGEITLILLPRSRVPAAPGRLVMGAVKYPSAQPDAPLAAWVYVDPVVTALGLKAAREDRPAVARALGRVIAHELIHVLVPHLGHSQSGLMASVLTLRDLRGSRLALASNFRAALRAPATLTALAVAGPPSVARDNRAGH